MSDSLRPYGLQPVRLLCSWQEYQSGQPFHSPGDLHDPGIEPRSLALQAYSLPSKPPGKSPCIHVSSPFWTSFPPQCPKKSFLCYTVGSHQLSSFTQHLGFPGGASGKEPICQCGRHERLMFDPWIGTIPWRRAWQLTSVFLPGESRGQRAWQAIQSVGSQKSQI